MLRIIREPRRLERQLLVEGRRVARTETAVGSFYGMNVPYPGFGSAWGVIGSSALMIVVSGGLYVLFRRRDWL